MPKRTILHLEQLHKSYSVEGKDFPVLENIDLTIKSPEIVSIVGRSGCGKTTLLNVIAGFLQPTHGKVYLDGKEVHANDQRIPMIFQQDTVFPWLTVHKNLTINPLVNAEESHQWLEHVELGEKKHIHPKFLSGGMRKRVEMARAFAGKPPMVLADEPFGFLDPVTKRRLQGLLSEVWAKQRTIVLFSTHDVEESLILSDRVVVLGGSPARIQRIISIPFLRPRPESLRFEPEFQHLRKEVEEILEMK
jgi:ABC-type nitrate/sulfonate/bicarbonate transport system ATPase subunit